MSRASLCASGCSSCYVKVGSVAGAVRAGYQNHDAGLYEVGLPLDGGGGKRGWTDTPFGRVAWINV
jgi:hypothetical protein